MLTWADEVCQDNSSNQSYPAKPFWGDWHVHTHMYRATIWLSVFREHVSEGSQTQRP